MNILNIVYIQERHSVYKNEEKKQAVLFIH